MDDLFITVVPGDGIGPEVIAVAQACMNATGITIDWDEQLAGVKALEAGLEVLPKQTLQSIKKRKLGLKGPLTTPIGSGFRSINVLLRQTLDLYANLRPIYSALGASTLYKDIDLVVIRENTEGLYAGIEYKKGTKDAKKLASFIEKTTSKKISASSSFGIKVHSVSATKKIMNYACLYAKEKKRKKITIVHKANILKFADGLFLKTCYSVGQKYNIKIEDKIVDNMAMQLVLKPQLYDVLVLPNLYGDIISDLCAGLIGGLGMAPSGNIGKKYALFEPVHGSAPKYTGQNKVNPCATVLSGALLFDHAGLHKEAQLIRNSVATIVKKNKHTTYDINPQHPVGTKEMGDSLVKHIKKNVR